MRTTALVLVTLALFAALILSSLLPATPVLALSEMCEFIDGATFPPSTLHNHVIQSDFEDGEVLRFIVTEVEPGNPATMRLSVTDPDGHTTTYGPIPAPGTLTHHFDESGEHIVSAIVDDAPVDPATYEFKYRCFERDEDDSDAGVPCQNVFDGRLNNDPAYDCGAPIAIYPGSLVIYAIDPTSGAGNQVIWLAEEQLTVPSDAVGNVLLAEATNPYTGQPILVHALTATNEIQVTTLYADGKFYTVAWPADRPDQWYHVAA